MLVAIAIARASEEPLKILAVGSENTPDAAEVSELIDGSLSQISPQLDRIGVSVELEYYHAACEHAIHQKLQASSYDAIIDITYHIGC
jgi:hypothetical protein